MPLTLQSPVAELTRVGKTVAGRLARLGVTTAEDLLYTFPFRHNDLSTITLIARLRPCETATIEATVDLIATKKSPRKRMLITEALLTDASGSCRATWFSQPYLTKSITKGERFYFSGKYVQDSYGVHLLAPAFERYASDTSHTARIIPHYHVTANITQKQIRFLIKQVVPLAQKIPDYLPTDLQKSERLMPLAQALRVLHFPNTVAELNKAKKRLAFDELFLLQLFTLQTKAKEGEKHAPRIPFQKDATRKFVAQLPFTLTNAQKKVSWTILQDVAGSTPSTRLVEGDVGSGKTVVAAIVMLNAAVSDMQSALLAPTEILAAQHASSLATLFAHTDIKIVLLTSAQTASYTRGEKMTGTKKETIAKIANGEALIIVGTHAVLQKTVIFRNLSIVFVDEQHRFGVEQRKVLTEKCVSGRPHLLSLSATPIPRSLHLTLYGDLALSQLDEMPPGRKPPITKLVSTAERSATYAFLRESIRHGHQLFVICPIINESDTLGIKAVATEFEHLKKNIFPEFTVAPLHGKMKTDEKSAVLKKFADGETQILCATSVVEVGIDIPQANLMIIEGAERFGLAQLHQFRGRIGRRGEQSYCFLFSNNWSPDVKKRLLTLAKYHDGFTLAEKDLEIRGPGDITGIRQSGLPLLKIATLTDRALAEKTRAAAREIIAQDPLINKHPLLQKKMRQFASSIHWE